MRHANQSLHCNSINPIVINWTRGPDNRLCNTIFTLILAKCHNTAPSCPNTRINSGWESMLFYQKGSDNKLKLQPDSYSSGVTETSAVGHEREASATQIAPGLLAEARSCEFQSHERWRREHLTRRPWCATDGR